MVNPTRVEGPYLNVSEVIELINLLPLTNEDRVTLLAEALERCAAHHFSPEGLSDEHWLEAARKVFRTSDSQS